MDKNINIILRFIIYFLFAFAVVSLITSGTESVAYAEDCFTDVKLTADFLSGVNGVTPVFENAIYYNKPDYGYRRNLKAEFTLTAPYYSFSYTVNRQERAKYAVCQVPEGGKAVFAAEETGYFEVTCYGFSDELGNDCLGERKVEFYNDDQEPYMIAPAMEEMSEWKKTGKEFIALIDWSVFRDDNSGIKSFYYVLQYEDGTPDETVCIDWKNADKTSVVLSKKTTVWTIAFDAAGNVCSQKYVFDKFDDVKPPMPSYTISPNEPQEGIYAKQYEIHVTFLDDNANGSGLAVKQKYKLNGKEQVFESSSATPESIVLDKPMDYTVVLYATDKAGNVSEERTITVPFSVFDITPPTIGEVSFTFDLMNADGICTLRTEISDSGESGVKNAELTGKGITLLRAPISGSTAYTATFDGFDFGQTIEIFAEDAIGNSSSHIVPFSFYSDAESMVFIRELTMKFRSINREQYTESQWKNITNASLTLCNLLRLENSTQDEIQSQAKKTLALLDSTVLTTYKILYIPEYASSTLTFTTEESDFVGYPKGVEVSVEMVSGNSDGKDYAAKAGFNDGFTDFLSLVLKVDGAELQTPLDAGLNVSMAMPSGYFDREIALFDMATGQRIETEVVNNEIHFRLKQTTTLALAIEGGKAPTGYNAGNENKTIDVFGQEMKLSTFLWIVCGCGGGALLIVAVLVVLMMIKKGKQI